MLNLQLDPGEKIILEMRKHWFIFLGPLLLFLVLALAPFILYKIFLSFASTSLDLSFITDNIFLLKFFFYPLWLLFLWVMLFVQWTNYYLDVWYVTEKRIIDIEQRSLFHREISNLRFDRIEDVSIHVNGLIATVLGFGNIQVQTAAENSKDFAMKGACHPERVKKLVFAQHNIAIEQGSPK